MKVVPHSPAWITHLAANPYPPSWSPCVRSSSTYATSYFPLHSYIPPSYEICYNETHLLTSRSTNPLPPIALFVPHRNHTIRRTQCHGTGRTIDLRQYPSKQSSTFRPYYPSRLPHNLTYNAYATPNRVGQGDWADSLRDGG
jgi:hypothetical protein